MSGLISFYKSGHFFIPATHPFYIDLTARKLLFTVNYLFTEARFIYVLPH
jgi:hypothetical protein